MAAGRAQILQLYRGMMRESSKLTSYNFRWAFLQVVI